MKAEITKKHEIKKLFNNLCFSKQTITENYSIILEI